MSQYKKENNLVDVDTIAQKLFEQEFCFPDYTIPNKLCYLKELSNPEKAQGNCLQASLAVCEHVMDVSMVSITHLAADNEPLKHYANIFGQTVLDFTATQYDARIVFPLILSLEDWFSWLLKVLNAKRVSLPKIESLFLDTQYSTIVSSSKSLSQVV